MIRQVGVQAGVLDVEDLGSGQPVVFIHPYVCSHLHWRNVLPLLENDMRCIAPTMPLGAHARPMRGDADLSPPGLARIVIDLLDSLGIERATLVGNDTGGAIAQIATTLEPDRVSRLILTSCDAYDVFPPKMFGYLKVVARIPGGVSILASSMVWIPGILRLPIAFGWVAKRPLDGELLKTYVAPLRSREIRRDVTKVTKGLDAKHTMQAAETLKKLDVPTLVAWGEEDRFFPKRLAERLVRELPNAQLEYIPDAATFTPEDNPRALADAIRKFVATD
jgi:pimeloyl-ACP methyl ester carboxylesterase